MIEATKHPTAEWLARKITEAFSWATAPRSLIRDDDGAYGHVFTGRVRATRIRDRPICPGSPWQNGIGERLIVTLRRECRDHIIVAGENHSRRVLTAYATYYNQTRAPVTPADSPLRRAIQRIGDVTVIPSLGDYITDYVRI